MTKPPRAMLTILTALFLATCCLLSTANAGVLLDNTNGGTASLDSSGYSLGYGNATFRGVQFTSSSNIELISMSLGLRKIGSPSNTVTAKLYHVGESTVTEIKSKAIDISTVDPTNLKAIDLTGFSLETGKTYRLGLSLTSTSTTDYLEWVKTLSPTPTSPVGSSGLTFESYQSLVGGTWTTGGTNASFYLQGTPSGASVPEPSAIALAIIGAGSMATRRLLLRRRRKS